jgi:hypothetical protein
MSSLKNGKKDFPEILFNLENFFELYEHGMLVFTHPILAVV